MANNGAGSDYSARKKIAKTYELILTSYHEAGHTVFGLLNLMKITSVYVFENKKNKRIEGFTHWDYQDIEKISDPALASKLSELEASCIYAGLEAEKYHFKLISGSRVFPMFFRKVPSDDLSLASDIIKKYNLAPPGKKRYLYKKKLMRESYAKLAEYWFDVELISHSLFQKKNLDFSNLKEILTKKSNKKYFWKEQFKKIEYIYDNYEHIDEKIIQSILDVNNL